MTRLGTIRFRHGGSVYGAFFSADGKTLTSYGEDNVFRTWDVATGRELRQRRRRGLQPEFFASAAVSPNGRLLALGCGSRGRDKDGTMLLCAIETGKQLQTFTMPDAGWAVRSLAFSADSKLVAAGDDQGHIDIWETVTGKRRRHLTWECMITGLAFSPDGQLLASGNGVDAISLWDVATGKEVRCFQSRGPGHVGKNTFEAHLAFTPNGTMLATANSDNAVRLWDVSSSKEIRRFHRGDEGVKADDWFKSVTGLAFSPDGTILAVDSWDGIIHLWSAATGEKLRRIDTRREPFGWRSFPVLVFSPDGRMLASWCAENTLRLWDVRTGEELTAAKAHRKAIRSIAFAPDGGTIATGGDDRQVRLWNPASGRECRFLRPPEVCYGIRCVAFSLDGQTLASTGDHGAIYRWRVASGVALSSLKAKEANDVHAVAFAPNGRLLATADSRSTGGIDSVTLWDSHAGKIIRELRSDERCLCLAFSPGGTLLATGVGEWITHDGGLWGEITTKYRGAIAIWDPETGEKRQHWIVTNSIVTSISFSPNGRWLVSVGEQNRRLRLWDAGTGKNVRQWPDTDCATISPAGRLIAAGDRNGTVRLWDFFSGELVKALKGHRGPVRSLAFSPDGRTLASGSDDTTGLVWDVTSFYERPRPVVAPLSPRQLAILWSDLGRGDSQTAYRAIDMLAADAEQSVPFLQSKLAPVSGTPARIDGLIRDLDAVEFSVRENALAELEKLDGAAVPALRTRLAGKPTLEQRRYIQLLLKKAPGAAETTAYLQALRGIEVLEAADTPEARKVLRTLAEGAPESRLTREAQASWKRLNARSPSAAR